ncbi:hypothetical protein FQN50_004138 [Emmonsiellopsis sp. PD_5]|nr:hypothetical protein FQN50_004138 [Emmonsiellopsis sp. PD_5]
MKALVLIDLQNEFLDPSKKRFAILDTSRDSLLKNITRLVPEFRAQKGDDGKENLVIWIRSEYSNSDPDPSLQPALEEEETDPSNTPPPAVQDHFLTGKHSGKTPCCAPGSYGAELHPAIQPLIDQERDIIITKSWFSSFKETPLATTLTSHQISHVYFAGLLSNVCVSATVSDSLQHHSASWTTHVLTDCLGYRRLEGHEYALRQFHEMAHQHSAPCTLLTSDELLSTPPTLPTLYYVNGSIPSWRVLLALNEKRIPITKERKFVMSVPKPTRTPEFLAINPRGKTPVFIDSDPQRTKTHESLAILHYLETYYPDRKALLPPVTDRAARARVLCMVQESENLHVKYDALEDGYWDAKREKRFDEFAANVRPGLIETVLEELGFWEGYADAARGVGKKFLAATDEMSLADCAVYPILAYMCHRGLVLGERFRALERYCGEMEGLESVRGARPEGWEGRGKADFFCGR